MASLRGGELSLPTVERISLTPVRTFRLSHPQQVELTERGAVENRRFLLVDGDGKRLRSSLTIWRAPVSAEWDAEGERLRVEVDGEVFEGSALPVGEPIVVESSDRKVSVRALEGPWTEALSALQGSPVRIARPDEPGELQLAPVTLVSRASLERLEREAGATVDPRRFRMLFDLDGCAEHEEDTWAGRRVRIGEAVVRVGIGVGRCAVTTRDPDTGERDLDTLRILRSYREQLPDGEIPFGVYAEVEEPGIVRVGDEVTPL
jgi:uncharacterized protein YcbX